MKLIGEHHQEIGLLLQEEATTVHMLVTQKDKSRTQSSRCQNKRVTEVKRFSHFSAVEIKPFILRQVGLLQIRGVF